MASSTTTLADIKVLRGILRDLYVYSHKSKEDFLASEGGPGFSGSRSTYHYDIKKIDTWLGEHLESYRVGKKKVQYLTVDSGEDPVNPFFDVFKRKAFDDSELVADFLILSVLRDEDGELRDIVYRIEELGEESDDPDAFMYEEPTIQYRLDYLEQQGCISSDHRKGIKVYHLMPSPDMEPWRDALQFASEMAPLGVIGSYSLDRLARDIPTLRFKHHFLFHALDSVPLLEVLRGISARCRVSVEYHAPHEDEPVQIHVIPLYMYISAQTGRQHIAGFVEEWGKHTFLRLDRIGVAECLDAAGDKLFQKYKDDFDEIRRHLWGIGLPYQPKLQHFSMNLRIPDEEAYALRRLQREKRNGTVEKIQEGVYRFSADLYDLMELRPWVRSWFGRILSIECDDEEFQTQCEDEIVTMLKGYGSNE